MNTLDAFVAAQLNARAAVLPTPPPKEPAEFAGAAFQRTLVAVPAPDLTVSAPTLAEARSIVDAALAHYLAEPQPDYMLLIKAAPGVGKTYRAVLAAERLARQGKRVLYAGPRHAFFQDVLALAETPEQWYEWLPRQEGDENNDQTCLHTEAIGNWINKGYDALQFCAGVCGWDYVNKACPWHAQKKRKEHIIFGQHAHVLAHPLQFHVVIGDESPLGAFLQEWGIGSKWIVPQGLDPQAELTHLLHKLASLSLQPGPLSGPKLLEQLGGAQWVLDACEEFIAIPNAVPLAPDVHTVGDADRADYFHLPQLIALLRREAKAAAAGLDYPARVILANERLLILRRRPVSDELPPHVIWLDATANEHIYTTTFGRPVEVVDAAPQLQGRVYQVWSRANGKGALNSDRSVEQLDRQIQAVAARYKAPAVITYQGLLPKLSKALPALHFYAARGTNAFETCDALIVAGTPMPAQDALLKQARMLYAERMEPFATRWSSRELAYAYVEQGQGWAYPIGGYWEDPDLQALLWNYREAELLQAAHRARPVSRNVDIWLLSNVPLPELPPYQLLSLQALFGAPDGVNVFKWDETLAAINALAEQLLASKGFVSAADLAEALVIHRSTANKYLGLLAETGEWLLTKKSAGGRPAQVIVRPSQ